MNLSSTKRSHSHPTRTKAISMLDPALLFTVSNGLIRVA